MRILIVDDHRAFRAGLRGHLEGHGFEVIEARDVLAGLQRAVEDAPDVVVVADVLSGSSGLEFAEALAEEAETRALPVVMTSEDEVPFASSPVLRATLSRTASAREWQRTLRGLRAHRAPITSVRPAPIAPRLGSFG